LQGTDCPYFTYELIANPVQGCRFVPKNSNKIVFVVYECLKSIRPFKEQVVIVIKKSRYQVPKNRLYTPYLFCDLWIDRCFFFVKYKEIRLIEI